MEESLDEMRGRLSEFLVDISQYTRLRVIGKGAAGCVWLALDPKTNEPCALKELNYENLAGRSLKLFCREVQILATCKHPFLLPLRGFTLSRPFSIVTDIMYNGSLFEALRHRPGSPNLTATQMTIIALGTASGMAYLHTREVMHRDLKSLNILLDNQCYPRICDFGIARFTDKQNEKLTQKIGTPHWMAPEVFEKATYGNKVDVFAYGIMLWEMLTCDMPYRGLNAQQIMVGVCRRHLRPRIPESCPGALRELMKSCWAWAPEQRPTFQAIYEQFASKQVAFPGTDLSAINEVVSFVARETLAQEAEIVDESEREARLMKLVDSLSDLPTLFAELERGIAFHATTVFKALRRLVLRNSDAMAALLKNPIWDSLPFGEESSFMAGYSLMFDVLNQVPDAANIDKFFANVQGHQKEIASLIAISRSDECISFVFGHIKALLAPKTAKLVFGLISDFMKLGRQNQLSDVLQAAFSSESSKVVNLGYRLLFNYFDPALIPKNFRKHLKKSKTTKSVAQVLVKWGEAPFSEPLAFALFATAREPLCIELLLEAAKTREPAEFIATNCSWWKASETDAIRLMLAVTEHSDIVLREAVVFEFCALIEKALNIARPPLSSICLLFKRLQLSESVMDFCERSGVFERFVKVAMKGHAQENVRAALLLVHVVGPAKWQPCFKAVVDAAGATDEPLVHCVLRPDRAQVNERTC
jgi:serine/threonine protein kinase